MKHAGSNPARDEKEQGGQSGLMKKRQYRELNRGFMLRRPRLILALSGRENARSTTRAVPTLTGMDRRGNSAFSTTQGNPFNTATFEVQAI